MLTKKKTIKQFLHDIVLSDNTVSTKRFVTLMMVLHLTLSSTLILIMFPVTVFMGTKGEASKIQLLIPVFNSILDKSFYIVLAGLGFISSVDVAAILKAKARHDVDVIYGGDYSYSTPRNDDDPLRINKVEDDNN